MIRRARTHLLLPASLIRGLGSLLHGKLRLPLLVTGAVASLLGTACSSATVTAPDTAQAAVTPDAAGKSAPQPPTEAPKPAPATPHAKAEPHPYAFLWEAAALGVNPYAHGRGTEVAAVPWTPPNPGGSQGGPGGEADPTGQPDPLLDGSPESNMPEPAASGGRLDESEANSAPDARHWRAEDLAEIAPYLQGIASWYGPNFHGKLTANGETYNQYGLTAAHPVLPIGTRIMVENLNNGRRVWLRINDRGPYAKGRILDMTRMAAERLGMIEQGTAPVRITVLKWPDTVQSSFGLKPYQQYTVQAAAYPDLDTAEDLRERLQARFPEMPFFVEPASNGFFAVAAGPFDEERDAKLFSRKVHASGINPIVKRYRN